MKMRLRSHCTTSTYICVFLDTFLNIRKFVDDSLFYFEFILMNLLIGLTNADAALAIFSS